MNKDLAIGIVGTLILITAMVGVFRYEASQASGSVFDVQFESKTVAGTTTSGTTQEGDTSRAGVDVDRRNVTRIEFVLEWTDDVGAPDEFNLTVTSPSGETRAAQAENGKVTVVFDNLAVSPPDARLAGRDEADVRERAQTFGSQAAIGRWNVTVSLVQAGDQAAPVGGVVVQEDASNEWTLTPRLTYYEAAFKGA